MRSRHSRSRVTWPSRRSLTLHAAATAPPPREGRLGPPWHRARLPSLPAPDALGGPRLASLGTWCLLALGRFAPEALAWENHTDVILCGWRVGDDTGVGRTPGQARERGGGPVRGGAAGAVDLPAAACRAGPAVS